MARLIVYAFRDAVPPVRDVERALRIHGIALSLDWIHPLAARSGTIEAELDGREARFDLVVAPRSDLDLVDHGDTTLTFAGDDDVGRAAAAWIARAVTVLARGVLCDPESGETVAAEEIDLAAEP